MLSWTFLCRRGVVSAGAHRRAHEEHINCNADSVKGTINAFGVFQTYYETNPLWHASPSNISWIGSIQAFLLLLVGVVSGPLYDAGYFRLLIAGGAFMIPFGFFMTSLCTSYWQTMLAQAFVIGIGNGLLFVPSVAVLPQYFTTHKSLANGIAASGSSFGGIIYPIVLRQLYPKIGFPWATRVLGFIALATAGSSFLIMRPRVMPKHKRHLTDLAAFKEPPYALFCLAMFFGFIGFYGPSKLSCPSTPVGFSLLSFLALLFYVGAILGWHITEGSEDDMHQGCYNHMARFPRHMPAVGVCPLLCSLLALPHL